MKKVLSILLVVVTVISSFTSFALTSFAASKKTNVTATWDSTGVKKINNKNLFYSNGKVYFFYTGKKSTPAKKSVKVCEPKTKKVIDPKFYVIQYETTNSSNVGTYRIKVVLNAEGYKKYQFLDSKKRPTNTEYLSYRILPSKVTNVKITKDKTNNKINISFTKGLGASETGMKAVFFSKSDAGRFNEVKNYTKGNTFSFTVPKDSGFTELFYIELTSYKDSYYSTYRSKYEPFNTNGKETISCDFLNGNFDSFKGYLNYGDEYENGGYEYTYQKNIIGYAYTGKDFTPNIKKDLSFGIRNTKEFSNRYTITAAAKKNFGVYSATVKLSDADYKKFQFANGKQSANITYVIMPQKPSNIKIVADKSKRTITITFKKGAGAKLTAIEVLDKNLQSLIYKETSNNKLVINIPKNTSLSKCNEICLSSFSNNKYIDFLEAYTYYSVNWK